MKNPKPKYMQFVTAHASEIRCDAGESAVVARALEHIEEQITEVLYAELKAALYVPAIGGIDPGAAVFTWRQGDIVGVAKRSSGRSGDLPRADAQTEEFSSKIESYGASYGYTIQQLREVALAARRGFNLQLDQTYAKGAATMIARAIDSVVAFGDADSNSTIRGFLNNASVVTQAAAGLWSGLTAAQLLAELFAMVNGVVVGSKEAIVPDTILLPQVQLNLVSQTMMGVNSDRSVLSVFRESQQQAGRPIEVAAWPTLETANAARTGPRAVCFKRDAEIAGSVIPLPFEAQAPQQVGLEIIVPCEGRCGGAVVRRPMGLIYRDGL
jgi:hypothetical protein